MRIAGVPASATLTIMNPRLRVFPASGTVRKCRGFTLIELLVVAAILAILAADLAFSVPYGNTTQYDFCRNQYQREGAG